MKNKRNHIANFFPSNESCATGLPSYQEKYLFREESLPAPELESLLKEDKKILRTQIYTQFLEAVRVFSSFNPSCGYMEE